MRLPSLPRTSLPTTFLAASCGAGLGLVTFILCAWLHAVGATGAAALLAEAALLIALACVAGFALFDGNTRLRGARVPINRALPPAWWPRDPDSVSLLAACVGGPLVIGAGRRSPAVPLTAPLSCCADLRVTRSGARSPNWPLRERTASGSDCARSPQRRKC